MKNINLLQYAVKYLSKYNSIIPCGIKDKGVTSMKKMGINDFQNINKIIIKKFLNIFL